jgi:hypothetical protein
MIRLLDDHPGTRIGAVSIYGDRVSAAMLHEPMTRADWVTHDYNVHFCVGIENSGDDARNVELSIEGGVWGDLPAISPLLYVSAMPDGPFEPASVEARTDLGKRYCIRVTITARARLYVANTLVRSPAAMAQEFDALGVTGGAMRRVIGTSLEGREIVAYVYGDPARQGTILVTSGFHPPEPDTFATAEIMRQLAMDAGRELLRTFAVAVVPVANPDGYARGTQGANAAGINFYWHFARELPDLCPEAAALWRYAGELSPRGHIDFHCYTFQARKQAGPYQRPPFFHDSASVRAACAGLYEALAARMPGKAVTGFGTYAPHTLGAMLAKAFDTVALAKYHLHLAEGETGCRARGLAVFETLADTLARHGLTEPGAPRRPGWREPFRAVLIYWSGLLRPTLGWLRRGRPDMVRLDRTALVSPEEQVGTSE